MTNNNDDANDASQNPADQSNLAFLVTCMQVSLAEWHCVLCSTRHLYKKHLVKGSIGFLYRIGIGSV